MQRKIIVVTGASKGIGLVTSQRLADAGYHVIGIARTNSIEDFPGDFFNCDLSNQTETENLLKVLLNTYDIAGLVNNVGAGGPQPLGEIDLDTLMSLYNINVRTAVQMTQGLIGKMKEKNGGVL